MVKEQIGNDWFERQKGSSLTDGSDESVGRAWADTRAFQKARRLGA